MNILGISAIFIGVPMAPTIRKMLSTFSNLLVALTAIGIWYCVSSTMNSILRP